jgi:hypothetical protein
VWESKTTPGSDYTLCTIYEAKPDGRAIARSVTPVNASLILRCVNSHEDLVAACKASEDALASMELLIIHADSDSSILAEFDRARVRARTLLDAVLAPAEPQPKEHDPC